MYRLIIFFIIFSSILIAQEEYVSSYTGEQIDQAIANALTGAFPANSISFTEMQKIADSRILGKYGPLSTEGEITTLTAVQVKSLLDLTNVENTKLSTWAGSTGLTTLGTITTGTWSASIIDTSRGGTGANNSAGARTNLGLVIGTNVQAYHSNLSNLSFVMSANILNLLSSNTYAEALGYLLPYQIPYPGAVFYADGTSGNWTYDIDSLAFGTIKADSIIINDTETIGEDLILKIIGSTGGSAGLLAGETVVVTGSSPSIGFKTGAITSDLTPVVMTSGRDWGLPDKSGTIAMLDDIIDPHYSLMIASPDSLTSFTITRLISGVTIDSVFALTQGASAEVTFNVSYGDDRSSGTDIFTIDQDTDNITVGETFTSFTSDPMNISKNNMLWLSINGIRNTPGEFLIVIYCTKI